MSLRARSLWRELAAAYDEIERRLAAAAWNDIAAVATCMGELEGSLRPLVAELAPARAAAHVPEAAVARVWRDSDALVESLATRLPGLLRTATAARDAIATRLVRSRIGRTHTTSYGDALTPSPRFTSRRV